MRTFHPDQMNPPAQAAGRAQGPQLKVDLPLGLVDRGIYTLEDEDPRARAFTLLRAQVLQSLARLNGKIVAVTSPGAGAGKSHVAANLAGAISRVQPACLVDLHLRRPAVADRFEIQAGPGVCAHLLGDASLAETRLFVEGERLSLFAEATSWRDPSQILASPSLAQFLQELRGLPDAPVCIIDAPPLLEHDDALLIGRHVDAVILVVEEARTSKPDLAQSVRLLRSTPILGTILNKSLALL